MQTSEKIMQDLLLMADIELNGNDPWDIQIRDERFFNRVLQDSSLGLGESYMDGWWECSAIDEFITRVIRAQLDQKVRNNTRYFFQVARAKLFNRQSEEKAFEVGIRHYDLGNELYQSMLDKRLTYSCGYWKTAKNLDDAQEAKLDLVCKKIGLKPGMTILDIGCGWGSFAKYAAEHYDVSVVGVTVSKEQLILANELCKGLPVELRLQDYREVQGKFDAVISIGSMEHIGTKNYKTYMQVVDRCLKENGIALIHTIGSNKSITTGEPWTDKYIFPNGVLPSISQLGGAMEGTFVMEDWHNFGPYYDKTLLAWYRNFEKAWPKLKEKYGSRFYRMWKYYLLSSAGGFRARSQQLWQMVFTQFGTPQPACRIN
ncbi:MAG: cyclopropane-fatty-acyl-phospholipid synthase [Chloroflexi bacterium HGW-Chloroflexi-4]|jgi:cyclopropane-fatty-acyl-phospholipid synthase|nr:MAG: cyclopropane-fatty-acyl-phospholipid synthase [Chloroflexi bacterium HGW-Chloroflexi-4]